MNSGLLSNTRMRYGIFSDIHSNVEALDAALEVYKKEGIERYLCLGDIVSYGPDPSQCIQIVRELKAKVIAGNHEWGVCAKSKLEDFTDIAQEALIWTKDALKEQELDFLGALPLVYEEENFILVHGSLDSPADFYYLNDMKDADRSLAALKKQVCFVGHTHRPGVFVERDEDLFFKPLKVLELEDNKRYIVNVGSIGQPRDRDCRACVVIYDTDTRTIELKRVEYDFRRTQEKILKSGLPESLAWRLAEGR